MGKAKPKQAATKPRTTKGRTKAQDTTGYEPLQRWSQGTGEEPDTRDPTAPDASSPPDDAQPVQCAKTPKERAEESQGQDTKPNTTQNPRAGQPPATPARQQPEHNGSTTPLPEMSTNADRQGDDQTTTKTATDQTTPSTSNAPKTLRDGTKNQLDTTTASTAARHTPLATADGQADRQGDVTLRSAAVGSEDSLPPPPGGLPYAHARQGESRAECWERLRKSARSAGLPRGQGKGTAYEYATQCVEVLFAPVIPEPEPVVESITEPVPESAPEPETLEIPVPEQEPAPEPASPIGDKSPPPDDGIAGLGELPADWPELPANASLQVEIAWVSANRLRVRDGNGVDLSRALSPAPSYSALSWLETSILFPSKFADISVKATQNQEDEKEHIRREKMSIEEVRAILAEMLEG